VAAVRKRSGEPGKRAHPSRPSRLSRQVWRQTVGRTEGWAIGNGGGAPSSNARKQTNTPGSRGVQATLARLPMGSCQIVPQGPAHRRGENGGIQKELRSTKPCVRTGSRQEEARDPKRQPKSVPYIRKVGGGAALMLSWDSQSRRLHVGMQWIGAGTGRPIPALTVMSRTVSSTAADTIVF